MDVLSTLCKIKKNIVFVQIGSNDADYGDPLREFILRYNWHGVMVEPVPYVFKRLQSKYGSRKGISLLNMAISDTDNDKEFYYLAESTDSLPPWYDQLGSFYCENILKHRDYIPDIECRLRTMLVPCITLQNLFKRYDIKQLDVFHVDVEGYDYEIIRHLDIHNLRPTVVIYEHIHLLEWQKMECESHLRNQSYYLFVQGSNTIALDVNKHQLIKHLSFIKESNHA